MPRFLLVGFFCFVCCAAFLSGTCMAGSNEGGDGSKNFKQPNVKPYESLASVLKASNSKSAPTEVSKKNSKSSSSKVSGKKYSSSKKSGYSKSKSAKKSAYNKSNSKKKSSSSKGKSSSKSASL